ncbi:MAG: Ig-like domain-containing protein [Deltaproteobacteria bacterium]
MAVERNTLVVGGLLAAAVIVVAGSYWLTSQRMPESPAPVVGVVDTQPVETVVEKAPEIGAEPALDIKDAPSFDLVRVEADGSAIIAGQAEPGATVEVMIDGVALATASADSTGKFVTFTDILPSDLPRGLSLSVTTEGTAVASDQTVIVAPFAAVKPELASEPAPESAPEIAATEPAKTPVQPVAESLAEASPGPTLLLAEKDGITVLQAPEVVDAPKNISIDSITYDTSGGVFLAGRGTTDGTVRVYVDNTEVTTTEIADNGQWRTDLPDVDKGVYTLRVDQISAEGKVISRTETPFQREDATLIAQANPLAEPSRPSELKILTVQPGNTLWAIANQKWGDGMLYVRVFEANKDRIRDPDLIYPGQVFDIPN